MKEKNIKNTKKNILIVGGAGYVGGAVTDILLAMKDQYNVRVLDCLIYEESYRKDVDFVNENILNTSKLASHLKWADAVIWLAAIVGDGACKWDEVLTIKTNQETVGFLVKNFKGRIVFTSTCSVYGAQENLILTETSHVQPLSLYAHTKFEAEKLLEKSDAIIFRLGTLFGISDVFSRVRMDLVANLLTARACLGGEISIFGGEQYRPLLHVRDAAQALVDALEVPTTKIARIYNICSVNIKMIELAKEIKKLFPKTKITITPMPFEDTRNYKVSNEKLIKELGFKTKYGLKEGIQEIADLLLSNRIKDFNNPRYSNQNFLKDLLKK